MKTVSKTAAKAMLNNKKINPSLFEQGYSILMPKDKADNWLKALRSGEYIQADSILHNPKTGSFCCLGVEQYCNNNRAVEYNDLEKEFMRLPSLHYLHENGYLFVNSNNKPNGSPRISEKISDVAELNDSTTVKKVKVNQHKMGYRTKHDHDFKAMANYLENAMLVY